MKQYRPKSPTYSLVVPALNESKLIVSSLNKIHAYLQQQNKLDDTELIVVAAKGHDNTAELAKSQSAKFPKFKLIEPGPPLGKGRDVRAGILAATGQYVVFTDADLATPVHHISNALEILEKSQADVVIGVRNLRAIHTGWLRPFVSLTANSLVRLLLLPKIADSQCGFKAFNQPAAQAIFKRLTILQWGFDMEVLMIAKSLKLKVKSLIINDWSDPKINEGLTDQSVLAVSLSTFRELLKIWLNRLKGAYR